MGWNHRILAKKYESGEIEFQIHEVYYDIKGKPNGYTANPIAIIGDSLSDIKWTLNKMIECCDKPILWFGDDFPNEYNK